MTFSGMMMVAFAANVIGAGMAVPQARKLARTRRVDGVSFVWAATSATVNAWWTVYAAFVGEVGILPVSVISVATYAAIGAAVIRLGEAPLRQLLPRSLVAGAVVTIVPTMALVMGGWPAVGIALGVLYSFQLAPAVIDVYRAADVSGVAAATWILALIEALLWGVYGLRRADHGLMTLAVTGVSMSSLVLARLVIRRPRTLTTRSGIEPPVFAAA